MLIFVMAVTDTEHPPAAGTVLAMATRPWDIKIVAVIIAAVLLLAVVRCRSRPPLARPGLILARHEFPKIRHHPNRLLIKLTPFLGNPYNLPQPITGSNSAYASYRNPPERVSHQAPSTAPRRWNKWLNL